jgi:hypothetical protein
MTNDKKSARRRYSQEFKAQVMAEWAARGASVVGEARAVNAHLREGDCLALAGCPVPFERDGAVLGLTVAAFDTGVDASRQRSL